MPERAAEQGRSTRPSRYLKPCSFQDNEFERPILHNRKDGYAICMGSNFIKATMSFALWL